MERAYAKLIKRFILLFIVVTFLALTGCWDKQELEERAYVIAMGIDKNKQDEKFIDVTFQIANPQVGSSASGDEANEPPSDIVTITATDISAAKELAHTIVTRRVSFRHLETLIVSEEFARSEMSHNVIASTIIEPEVRHSMKVIVSKENVREFIDANRPKLETRPHKYYQFMHERWRDVGYAPDADLNRYFQRLNGELYLAAYATAEKTNQEPVVNGYTAGEVPQKGGDPVQMSGSAVFRYGKMLGTLSGAETRISLFLREKAFMRNAFSTFTDPLKKNFTISARILEMQAPKVKLHLENEPIEIDVTVSVRLQMMSDLSLTNYSTNAKNQQILRESVQDQLKEKTEALIKKTQEEFEAEPFMWHLVARRQFKTWQEYKDFNWEEKYRNANVNVTYNVEIANFGEQGEPATLGKKD